MEYVVDAPAIIEAGRVSFIDSQVNEVTFQHKAYTAGNLNVRWCKIDDNKIIGSVFPA